MDKLHTRRDNRVDATLRFSSADKTFQAITERTQRLIVMGRGAQNPRLSTPDDWYLKPLPLHFLHVLQSCSLPDITFFYTVDSPNRMDYRVNNIWR